MLSFPGAHSDPPFLHSGPGLSTLEVPEVTRKVTSAICRLGQLTPQVPKKVRLVHMGVLAAWWSFPFSWEDRVCKINQVGFPEDVSPGLKCEKFRDAPECGENKVAELSCPRPT